MSNKYILVTFFLLFSLFSNVVVYAEQINTVAEIATIENIQAGIHYKRLTDKVRNNKIVQQLTISNDKKVKIIMFFNYGCGICRSLNQPFDKWTSRQDPKKTAIYKLPASFNRGWATLANVFYAVQALDHADKLDELIFAGIHEQGLPLWDEQKLIEFLAKHDVNVINFKNSLKSFKVNTQVKWAKDVAMAFELYSIPHIIVSGPYGSYLTNLSMTRDQKLLFTVVDYLVKKELKETD